jgi:hypothetical protein
VHQEVKRGQAEPSTSPSWLFTDILLPFYTSTPILGAPAYIQSSEGYHLCCNSWIRSLGTKPKCRQNNTAGQGKLSPYVYKSRLPTSFRYPCLPSFIQLQSSSPISYPCHLGIPERSSTFTVDNDKPSRARAPRWCVQSNMARITDPNARITLRICFYLLFEQL